MAEATRPRDNPLHRGLPDEIAIWEILVRLPPKAVLRCRAVCPLWRRATSSRDFLLAHHARQPTLSLLRTCYTSDSLGIIPIDHQTVLAADQMQSIERLGSVNFSLGASCDGLLVLCSNSTGLCICNPATRQYAPLPRLGGFTLGGMYLHSPTSEYRLLMYKDLRFDELQPAHENAYYVYTIGSRQPPRHIGNIGHNLTPWFASGYSSVPVLFRGNLHWYIRQMLMVFDTTAESLQQMRSPVFSPNASLVEIDGMLGVYNLNYDGAVSMDMWVMQDYGSDLWALKHRIEFHFAELRPQFERPLNGSWVVPSGDGDVLVLLRFGNTLLQIDTTGKLVASFLQKGLVPTQLRLKQTLVPHTFFPTLNGYAVNASPSI